MEAVVVSVSADVDLGASVSADVVTVVVSAVLLWVVADVGCVVVSVVLAGISADVVVGRSVVTVVCVAASSSNIAS